MGGIRKIDTCKVCKIDIGLKKAATRREYQQNVFKIKI